MASQAARECGALSVYLSFPLKRFVADLNFCRPKTAKLFLRILGLSVGEEAFFAVFRAGSEGMWGENDSPADFLDSQSVLLCFPDNLQWWKLGSQASHPCPRACPPTCLPTSLPACFPVSLNPVPVLPDVRPVHAPPLARAVEG